MPESMPRVVYYAAVSADGLIARADGAVDWLDRFASPDLGFEDFLASVGTVVLGRATFEMVRRLAEDWPYPAREGLVLTSRPIAGSLPHGVRTVDVAALPAAIEDRLNESDRDVWIVGGGRTASACLEAGVLGELELYVIPILIGDGVPLFGRPGRPADLRLIETRTFANGVVMIRSAVVR